MTDITQVKSSAIAWEREECCLWCRWWEDAEDYTTFPKRKGWCFNTPGSRTSHNCTVWSRALGSDFCSKFERRPLPKQEEEPTHTKRGEISLCICGLCRRRAESPEEDESSLCTVDDTKLIPTADARIYIRIDGELCPIDPQKEEKR